MRDEDFHLLNSVVPENSQSDCGLITHIKINSVYKNKCEFILVSVQSSQVPLLQGDTVDHNEVVQVVLDCTCSSWKSSRLDNGVT